MLAWARGVEERAKKKFYSIEVLYKVIVNRVKVKARERWAGT